MTWFNSLIDWFHSVTRVGLWNSLTRVVDLLVRLGLFTDLESNQRTDQNKKREITNNLEKWRAFSSTN